MGVLKHVVAEMLGKHPHMAKFYPAPWQEGGAGATIVGLRSDCPACAIGVLSGAALGVRRDL